MPGVGGRRYDPRTVHSLGGTMRRTTTVILACLLLAGAAACSSGPSYNETVKNCSAALAAQYKAGGSGKPKECKGVKADDYNVLVGNAALGNLGWTDSDGNFDENKMLDSATETP